VVELDEAPEFQALSYVWGSPDDPVDIVCENKVVSVTQNLHRALLRLRHACYLIRRVWIDALCINQGDLDEQA
jgi:Heterokaryon incompatibility protein (HET)